MLGNKNHERLIPIRVTLRPLLQVYFVQLLHSVGAAVNALSEDFPLMEQHFLHQGFLFNPQKQNWVNEDNYNIKRGKAVETWKGNITASIYHSPSVQEHLPPLERQLWTRSFCRGLSFGQKAAIKKFQKVSGNFQRGERQGDNSFINIFTLSARNIIQNRTNYNF